MAKRAAIGPVSLDLSHIAEPLRGLAVRCDALVLDPANARRHPARNLDAIRGSLRTYGQVKPIVVRKDTNVVVAGNGTVEAARSLGWTHVAAVLTDMDAIAAAGFGIADNCTAELAEWDEEALATLLVALPASGDPHLDAMMDELRRAGQDETEPDEPAGDESGQLAESYQILIECDGEQQQAQLLERFAVEGIKCRSLIS